MPIKDGPPVRYDFARGGRYEPHPGDYLRKPFGHHVMGLVTQVVAINTFDNITWDFFVSVVGNATEIRQRAENSASNRLKGSVSVLQVLNRALRGAGVAHIGEQKSQVSDLFTTHQRDAARRFGTLEMSNSGIDAGIFEEITTIGGVVADIAKRRPSLKLHHTENLIDFLCDPHTPRIFRGFATGGNGFIDGFTFNHHPSTMPWRSRSQFRDVLDESGTQVSQAVLKAAKRSHKLNEALLSDPIPATLDQVEINLTGLTGNAKRYSSGCPAKHHVYRSDIAELVTHDLSLGSKQFDILQGQTIPPTLQKFDNNVYLLQRDAYAETCAVLATALELVA